MVPASAGRREPKKFLHSELQGCDIFRELGEQRGAGGNAKCWGGSPFAGGKMLNAWGGPDVSFWSQRGGQPTILRSPLSPAEIVV